MSFLCNARSAYFQQIEEDVKKHSASILVMKTSLDSFETKDMKELLKFHQCMEQKLENLTDETQVEQHPYSLSLNIEASLSFSFDYLRENGWGEASPKGSHESSNWAHLVKTEIHRVVYKFFLHNPSMSSDSFFCLIKALHGCRCCPGLKVFP